MIALPTVLEGRIERKTGCAWEASRISCNPLGVSLRVEDAILWNAPDFDSERPLLAIRSLEARCSFRAAVSGEGDIDWVDLDLSRLTLVIDERGRLNLDEFARDLFGEELGLGKSGKILRCRLKVDVVDIVDYSGPKVVSKSLRLGVNVDDYEAKGVVGLFEPVFRILSRTENLPVRKPLRVLVPSVGSGWG